MKYERAGPEDIWDGDGLRASVFLLDVRTRAEFEAVRIPGATNIPLDELGERAAEIRAHEGETLAITCHTVFRSKVAHHELQRLGFSDLRVLSGGIVRWLERGLPVERGAKALSLQRQLRLMVGGLVLGGVLLAAVSPWFLVLPALVGAGLLVAGTSDAYGLEPLVARLPWNRVGRRQE